ncbi:DUF5686 family protein [Flavobacterium rhizosphaerae]|uniref:DUF5686 family protein n=1 Tax=Flavobacterium rhizosphaerae TaxID=3163298 RepID=A0ABW8YXI1_9FLAO
MKKLWTLFVFFVYLICNAQVTGKITNENGEAIPFALISAQNTYKSALTNPDGNYTFNLDDGQYTILYSAIGYKPSTKNVQVTGNAVTQNIVLQREDYQNQAETNTSQNKEAALDIMKNAIAARKSNAEKSAKYTAGFYSLGEYRLKDVPKEVLEKQIGNLKPYLDSTGSGIIYLSETLSELKLNSPDDMYEHITASRVSGDNTGYSFNMATDAHFNFYSNYLPFKVNVVSPLADNALSYYDYELENTFYIQGYKQVHKIKVVPKVDSQPVVEGDIYIVEGTYELYSLSLSVKGSRIKEPYINTINIQQIFAYNSNDNIWVKSAQILNFEAGILGMGLTGMYTYLYTDYKFNPEFGPKEFGSEIISFEKDANQKDDAYWEGIRALPLTTEQLDDYKRKARFEELSGTKAYKDSIDAIRNKFKWHAVALGYTYHNSYKNWDVTYTGIARRLAFNTVQAYWLGPGFYFTKRQSGTSNYTSFGTDLNYGFAEQRFRATGFITRKFNSFTNRTISLSGGSSIEQYNREKPINKVVNSISSLFFRENYMKLYDNTFLKLAYEEEVLNGIHFVGSAAYTRRHALHNNTDFSTLKDIYKPYTSNNPLLPYDYETPAFLKHSMYIASAGFAITFGQKYITTPSRREIIVTKKLPLININFEKGFGSSISDYNFNHLSAAVSYDLVLGDKGELGTNFRAGKFFDSDNIAFTDYRHFNGNQTHVGKSERYLNVFNFLPYYTHSTNDQYFEAHLEHNFKGYLLNSIPVLNKLNYYLVTGYHFLAVPEHKPYMEYTLGLDNLGWGKARFLRFDYIWSYEGGNANSGVLFGLTFIDFLE